jgi:hypothetical protein
MTTMCRSEIREYYVQVKGRAVRYGTQGQLTMASAWPKGGGGRDAVEEAGGSSATSILDMDRTGMLHTAPAAQGGH